MEYWHLLPEHFKKSVVKNLDYKSRCCFRKCSKSERDLVDKCSVILDNVDLQTRTDNNIYFGIGEYKDSETILCDNSCNIDDAIKDFLLIFKNPKSGINKLVITDHDFKQNSEALINLISYLLSKMPGAIDSKMENLNIENCSVFLNYLEPSESKVLRIDSIRKFLRQSAGVLEKLIGTEQSKSFNVVQIQKAVDVDSERIVNAGSFCVYIDNMDADFFWNFIQKYMTIPFPFVSFFQVFTTDEIPISDLLSMFDVPVINEPLEGDNLSNYFIHTQRFEVPWSQDHLLIVKFANQMVAGGLCREKFLSIDFDRLEHI